MSEHWSRERVQAAVEQAMEDYRQRAVMLSDDTVPTVMSWYSAHRLHEHEPYIGCPFCHESFVPRAELERVERERDLALKALGFESYEQARALMMEQLRAPQGAS